MDEFRSSELQKFGSGDDFQEAVISFLANLTKNTREAYKTDLKRFFEFLRLKGISPLKVRQIHIEEFMKFVSLAGGKISYDKPNPASVRTYNRKLATLKSFYQFLGHKRLVDINPTTFVKSKRMSLKVETHDLSQEKVKELFELIPKDNFKHSRDRALLATLFYTGMRASEVQFIKRSDYLKIKEINVFKIKAKGGEERTIPLNPQLVKEIDHYLKVAESDGLKREENLPLFCSLQSSDTFLSRTSINLIFAKWTRKLKLTYKVSPHSARATLIGTLHDMGVGLRDQAEAVAHRDIKMTNAYNKRKKNLEENPLLRITQF